MADKLYPVVYDLLVNCGYTKTAAKCLKDINQTEKAMKTSESLVKMYEDYLVKSKKEVAVVAAKKEESSDEESSEEESEEEEKVVAVVKKVVPAAKAKVTISKYRLTLSVTATVVKFFCILPAYNLISSTL